MKSKTKTIKFLRKAFAAIGVFTASLAFALCAGWQGNAVSAAGVLDTTGTPVNYTRTADGGMNVNLIPGTMTVYSAETTYSDDKLVYDEVFAVGEKIDAYVKPAAMADHFLILSFKDANDTTDVFPYEVRITNTGSGYQIFLYRYYAENQTWINAFEYQIFNAASDGTLPISIRVTDSVTEFYYNNELLESWGNVNQWSFSSRVIQCTFSAAVNTAWGTQVSGELPAYIRMGNATYDDLYVNADTSRSLEYSKTDGGINVTMAASTNTGSVQSTDKLVYNEVLTTEEEINVYLSPSVVSTATHYVVMGLKDAVSDGNVFEMYLADAWNGTTGAMEHNIYIPASGSWFSKTKPSDNVAPISIRVTESGMTVLYNGEELATLEITSESFPNGIQCYFRAEAIIWNAETESAVELPVYIRVGDEVEEKAYVNAAGSALSYSTEADGGINVTMQASDGSTVFSNDKLIYNEVFTGEEEINVTVKPKYIGNTATQYIVIGLLNPIDGNIHYEIYIGNYYNSEYNVRTWGGIWTNYGMAADGTANVSFEITSIGTNVYYNGSLLETYTSINLSTFSEGVQLVYYASAYVEYGGTAGRLPTYIRTEKGEKVNDTWDFASVSTEGTPVLNFYMDISEKTIADPDAYLSLTRNGEETKMNVSEATQNSGYYVFTYEVPAKNMRDVITVQMIRSDGTASVQYTYSVAQYAETIINAEVGTYSEETVAVVEAMLQYGDYAAAHFSGKVVEANEAINGVTAETLQAFAIETNGELPAGVEVLGMTLILEAEADLRIYFTANVVPECSVGDNVVNASINGDVYYVAIENIAAKDLHKEFTVSIGGYELKVCALDYAGIVCGSEDTALVNLVKALYLYNQAAKDYPYNQ